MKFVRSGQYYLVQTPHRIVIYMYLTYNAGKRTDLNSIYFHFVLP